MVMGFRRRRWLWQDKLIQRERTDQAKVFSLFPKSDNQPLQSNKALQQTCCFMPIVLSGDFSSVRPGCG